MPQTKKRGIFEILLEKLKSKPSTREDVWLKAEKARLMDDIAKSMG